MENISEEFLDDGEFSDDYLWLRWDNSCKQITYKRPLLEIIARKYNINPDNYKNKNVDYFCVFDDRHRNIFKDFINAFAPIFDKLSEIISKLSVFSIFNLF